MPTIPTKHNWVQFNSHENQRFQNEDDEDENDTLSLSDLPITDNNFDTNPKNGDKHDQDFEFGSGYTTAANKSPDNMCNAADIFFQGHILPLRHPVSSEAKPVHDPRTINRSASLTDPRTKRPTGCRIRNRFHSHPSPSPQIRTQSFRTLSYPTHKTSTLWSFLQVGLVKPQEIGLSDLKNRSKRFGSHNSNSSGTSSSVSSTIDQNQTQTQNPRKNIKKKQRLFFGSGCKCSVSVDSVSNVRIIKETVVQKKETTSFKENTVIGRERKERVSVSRHRTFEWLKQLSLAAVMET